MWLFWSVLIVCCVIGAIPLLGRAGGRAKIRMEIERVDGLSVSYSYVSEDGKTGIVIDENQRVMRLYQAHGNEITSKDHSFGNLLAVELLQSGQTVTKVSRSSQTGNAILGGLLLGGTGALVGAFTGNSISDQKVNRIDVQLTLNDIDEPVFRLNFMVTPDSVGTATHAADLELANKWMGRFKVIIKVADEGDEGYRSTTVGRASFSAPTTASYMGINQVTSVADELRKLSDLVREGVLSDDEFNTRKTRLLNGS